MRFIIIHKTNARWEAGEIPDAGLIADVGALIGDLKRAGILRAGEGLRASSQGARVTVSGGAIRVAPGPFVAGHELPAGFDIIRAATLDEAVAWASEIGRGLGDVEMDVRPVTEPWDIGLGAKPAGVASRRFMVLRKATRETESGTPLAQDRREALARARAAKGADHLVAETMRPSARGRRCKNAAAGVAFTDGPFTESKELVAGYVIIEVGSLDEASRWGARYVTTVRSDEADVFELEDPPGRTPSLPAHELGDLD
jgi:hypothetical protein